MAAALPPAGILKSWASPTSEAGLDIFSQIINRKKKDKRADGGTGA